MEFQFWKPNCLLFRSHAIETQRLSPELVEVALVLQNVLALTRYVSGCFHKTTTITEIIMLFHSELDQPIKPYPFVVELCSPSVGFAEIVAQDFAHGHCGKRVLA